MGISFAGVDLLLEDGDGELKQWLDQYIPFEDQRPFADEAPAVKNRPLGLTIPNWARELRPKINTWYSPTGASRWGFGFFLATGAMVQKIIASPGNSIFYPSTGQTLPAGMSTLVLNDPVHRLGRAVQCAMLPPHPVSVYNNNPNSAWILPIVDVRYFWQFQPASGFFLASVPTDPLTAATWSSTLLSAVPTLLMGMLNVLVPGTPPAAYLVPNPWIEQRQSWQNAAVLLDVLLASIGWRLVPRDMTLYGGANPGGFPWFAFQDYATAQAMVNVNNTAVSEVVGAQQVGVLVPNKGDLGSIVPSSIAVIFQNFANGITLADSVSGRSQYTFTAAQCGFTALPTNGIVKYIRSTALANITEKTWLGTGAIDNNTSLNALAKQIAIDHYGWLSWFQDQSFAGIGRQLQTGFDDYREYIFQRLPDGTETARTRVHTMPHNFACDDLLHWDNTVTSWSFVDAGVGVGSANASTWEWGNVIFGVTAGLTPANGKGLIRVTSADVQTPATIQPDATSNAYLVVNEVQGSDIQSGSSICAIREGQKWAVIESTATTSATLIGFCSTTTTAGTAETTTATFTLTTGGTITALIRGGLVYASKNYLICKTAAGYEVVNPTLAGDGKTTSPIAKGSSGTVTIFKETVIGDQTSSGVTLSGYARFVAVPVGQVRWEWNRDSCNFLISANEC